MCRKLLRALDQQIISYDKGDVRKEVVYMVISQIFEKLTPV